MEQTNPDPVQPLAKRASKRWKWMILIFVVADFWGIWYIQDSTHMPIFKSPDSTLKAAQIDNVPYKVEQKFIALQSPYGVTLAKCIKENKTIYSISVGFGSPTVYYL